MLAPYTAFCGNFSYIFYLGSSVWFKNKLSYQDSCRCFDLVPPFHRVVNCHSATDSTQQCSRSVCLVTASPHQSRPDCLFSPKKRDKVISHGSHNVVTLQLNSVNLKSQRMMQWKEWVMVTARICWFGGDFEK